MKVLIVLAMALAVTSASLLHEASPLVQQAFGQIRTNLASNFKASSRADVHFQNEFVGAMEQHVEGVLGQIQAFINAGKAVAEDTAAQIEALKQELAELIAAFEANPNADVEAFISAKAEIIKKIIDLLDIGKVVIANSAVAQHLKALVDSLDLTETVYVALRTVLEETDGHKVVAILQANNFVVGSAVPFGFWDTITDGIGGVIGGIGNIGDKIKDILNNIGNAAGKFKAVKELVEKLANTDWSNLEKLGKDGAQALLEAIAPYYCDIGKLAATLVSKLIASYVGLTIPPRIIVAVGGNIASIITGNPVSCS